MISDNLSIRETNERHLRGENALLNVVRGQLLVSQLLQGRVPRLVAVPGILGIRRVNVQGKRTAQALGTLHVYGPAHSLGQPHADMKA